MQRRVVLFVGLLLCLPAMAQAVSVNVPAGPNNRAAAPGQTIIISVTGGPDAATAWDLDVTFGPGGPTITSIDMTSAGNMFAGEAPATYTPSVPINQIPPGSIHSHATVSSAGNHGLPGQLAIITFDGTGKSGAFSLKLDTNTGGVSTGYSDAGGNDNFFPDISVVNGVVNFPVPEPSSIIMGLFAAAGMAVVIRKRHARSAA